MEKTRRLVLIGDSAFAEVACEYFAHDSEYDVVAFSVEEAFLRRDRLFGLPVVPVEELARHFRRLPGDAPGRRVLVYESRTVARAQYIAASDEGTRACALDLILDLLVRKAYPHKRYIDLGTSEASGGSGLNDGVLEFKESFGARAVAQDTYELAIA